MTKKLCISCTRKSTQFKLEAKNFLPKIKKDVAAEWPVTFGIIQLLENLRNKVNAINQPQSHPIPKFEPG